MIFKPPMGVGMIPSRLDVTKMMFVKPAVPVYYRLKMVEWIVNGERVYFCSNSRTLRLTQNKVLRVVFEFDCFGTHNLDGPF